MVSSRIHTYPFAPTQISLFYLSDQPTENKLHCVSFIYSILRKWYSSWISRRVCIVVLSSVITDQIWIEIKYSNGRNIAEVQTKNGMHYKWKLIPTDIHGVAVSYTQFDKRYTWNIGLQCRALSIFSVIYTTLNILRKSNMCVTIAWIVR